MNPADFIRHNLTLQPVPSLPAISLYTAHSGSRLSRLLDDEGAAPPYWAYQWAGGLALARHVLLHPHLVAGRRVLDLGAGSGLVGIAAAKSGARASAAEIDSNARAAIALNAEANSVSLPLVAVDIGGDAPLDIDLIAAGDVFYNPEVASSMLPFLQRCQAAGIEVLVGDPDRQDLPSGQLERIASYPVSDVGDARTSAERVGSVYRLV